MKNVLHLLFALCVLVFAGCDRGDNGAKPKKIVKIGVIAPLSGPQEQWGKNGLLGVKTAIAAQPVLDSGTKPELILEDDRNEPELTRSAFKKLVEEDQVSVVLMFSDSRAVLQALKDVENYQTPVLVFFSTHPGVTENSLGYPGPHSMISPRERWPLFM